MLAALLQTQLAKATAERDEARRVSKDLKAMMGDVLQRQSADMQQQHTLVQVPEMSAYYCMLTLQ